MHSKFLARAPRLSSSVVAIALVISAACGGKAAPPRAFPPADVGIVTVQPQTLPQSYDMVGQVEPSRRTEVRARVEGVVLERPFTEGAAVTPGQVLYRLDRVKTEAAYASANAHYINAKSTLGRLEPLLAKHAVAQQDVDNARAELDAAKAALDQAKKDLDDSVVRAEVAGRVGRARFEVGARVTGPADLLTTIDDLNPAYVVFRPSSAQVLAWKADPRSAPLLEPGGKLAVHVVLASGDTLPRTGRLTFVSPSLDSATGTQEFRATFENHDRVLLPGQFVNVRLSGFSRANALAVPQRAIQQGLGRQFVYVVAAGDTVVARDVKTGPWSGSLWIVDSGLTAGDRVIVDGIQKAAPGRVVKPAPIQATDSGTKAPGIHK
ncbi:MAG TPA: efflux RND transporter periplasmic adaptor subunit [Gemmatimonadaceae bacterium]|nr:efflux RND transporter periplasmic adaptor subunit [Gemmatimonadaceae bacterium]